MSAGKRLYDLIHSLTPSEKGYFKKRTKAFAVDKKTGYLSLFDTIDGMNSYDEAEIRAQADLGSSFGNVQKYLFEQIVQILSKYHDDFAKSFEVINMLSDIEILYVKGQFHSCLAIIRKAEQIASKFEFCEQMIMLLKWELTIKTSIGQLTPKGSVEIGERITYYRRLSEAIETYRILSLRLLQLFREKGYKRGLGTAGGELEKLRLEMRSLSKEFSESADLQIQQLNYKLLLDRMSGNKQGLEIALELVELYEKTGWEKHKSANYIILVQLLSTEYLKRNMFRSYASSLEKIKRHYRNLPVIRKTLLASDWIFTHLVDHNLFYIKVGEFDKMAHPDSFSYTDEQKQNSWNVLQAQLIFKEFAKQNFKRALQEINRLYEQLPTNKIRQDLVSYLHILELLIHYELGNLDLLSLRTQSSTRKLKRKSLFTNVERMIMQFFRDHLSARNDAERSEALHSLHNWLQENAEDKELLEFEAYFDIRSWVTAKLSSKSFVETLIKKTKSLTPEGEWLKTEELPSPVPA